MSEEIRAGFTRARRFLIAISLALACFKVLELDFTQVSILGNSATIKRPEQVIVLIWIAWIWAVVQYLVWFRDVGGWSEFVRASTEDCIQRIGRKALLEPIPEWLKKQLADDLGKRLQHTSNGAIGYSVSYKDVNGGGQTTDWALQMYAEAHVRSDNHYLEVAGPVRFERPIPRDEWQRHLRRSMILALLTRRFIPEYFAPFAIALLPVATII